MQNPLGISRIILSMVIVTFVVVSCSKELSQSSGSTGSSTTTSSSSSVIAVSVDSSSTDSIFIIQHCNPGFARDSIAASSLPSGITGYLDSNYVGYNLRSAYVIKDSSGTLGGYVVIINFNNKPVGLLFDASGNFTQVLEQREEGDMDNDGWHSGGRYENRDKFHRDTLTLSALPSSISSYMSSNYPGDTLVKAFQDRDSSIVIISKDNGLFATVFSSSGNFVNRISLTQPLTVIQNITQDSLPSADLSYLTSTYPNYVFESAISVIQDNQLTGYVVVVDANNTKYAIMFDARGNVLATKTIW